MLRLASDADVHGEIIRGLRRRVPGIDLVRVLDVLPDRNTMVGFAYQRVAAGDSVPGLIVTTNEQSIGSAIVDILLLAMRAC
jgi:hypothetical protein